MGCFIELLLDRGQENTRKIVVQSFPDEERTKRNNNKWAKVKTCERLVRGRCWVTSYSRCTEHITKKTMVHFELNANGRKRRLGLFLKIAIYVCSGYPPTPEILPLESTIVRNLVPPRIIFYMQSHLLYSVIQSWLAWVKPLFWQIFWIITQESLDKFQNSWIKRIERAELIQTGHVWS